MRVNDAAGNICQAHLVLEVARMHLEASSGAAHLPPPVRLIRVRACSSLSTGARAKAWCLLIHAVGSVSLSLIPRLLS